LANKGPKTQRGKRSIELEQPRLVARGIRGKHHDKKKGPAATNKPVKCRNKLKGKGLRLGGPWNDRKEGKKKGNIEALQGFTGWDGNCDMFRATTIRRGYQTG